jgi:hypothetical protein
MDIDTELLIDAKAFNLVKEYREENPGEPITKSMLDNFRIQATHEVEEANKMQY